MHTPPYIFVATRPLTLRITEMLTLDLEKANDTKLPGYLHIDVAHSAAQPTPPTQEDKEPESVEQPHAPLASNAAMSGTDSGQNNNLYKDQSKALPIGWERRINRNGLVYYLDHNTRTTTWSDPRGPQTEASLKPLQKDSEQGLLPLGWEVRRSSSGREYFLNHNAKTTTWKDPRLPSPLDANEPPQPNNCQVRVMLVKPRL